MIELGHRERHLTGGMGVQLFFIGTLVFFYSQALREVHSQRTLFLKLSEQAADARAQITRKGTPDVGHLRQENFIRWESSMTTPKLLPEWGRRFQALARDRFDLQDVELRISEAPERSVKIPMAGRSPLEVPLYAIRLDGMGSTRAVAAFLESVDRSNLKLLAPLTSLELKFTGQESALPVSFEATWLVPVSSELVTQKPPSPADWDPIIPLIPWGSREEPFLSSFAAPRAIRTPTHLRKRFPLTGISWTSNAPSCVIGGTVYKPGDMIQDYQLILITPAAVILQKGAEEIFLTLAPAG